MVLGGIPERVEFFQRAIFETFASLVNGALVAFLVIAHIIVFRVRLARFYCPECAKRLPLKWPPPGEFVRFHCRDCRIIWLTSIEVREDSGS